MTLQNNSPMSAGSALRSPSGISWALLVLLSLASYWLGTDHGVSDKTAACAILLAVATGKVYLIGSEFMELRHADTRLLRAFQGYCLVLAVGLIGMLIVL